MKRLTSTLGVSGSRFFLALAICLSGVLLAFFSLAAAPSANSASDAPAGALAAIKIAPWLRAQMVDGSESEFLVVLAEQADLSGADALTTKEEKGRYVRDVLWETAQRTQPPVLAALTERGLEHRAYYIVNFIWARGTAADALALAARADVARIEGNPRISNFVEPIQEEAAAPFQPQSLTGIEPGITYSHAPDVWATGFTGQGVVVGGADTGIRWTHAALKNKYRGWNGAAADHNFNWHDSVHSGGGVCGPNSPFPCDDNNHGTHTMGTAVGDDGATNQTGMAPGAKWIGCRNMDQGNGTPTTYIECMEFFLAPYPIGGTTAQGDVTKSPDVTNNSWGCPAAEGCSASTLQQAIEAQRAAGIMTVAAAGNSGSACSTVSDPPAIYEASYSIGALASGTDNITSFSSRGPVTVDGSQRRKPNLSAPGASVRSAIAASDVSYATFSGTSMASPHVAGAVALLVSARPALRDDVTFIRSTLDRSAVHLLASTCDGGGPTISPNNTFGYGRLDAKAAVDDVLQLTNAVSRKSHAGLSFDISLLDATPAVESRNSAGNHLLVFTFNSNVTTGSVAVTSGSGSVAGTPSFSGTTMSVDLTGVADAQKITVSLSNVSDGALRLLPPTTVSLGTLVGDSNGDGLVNSGDAIQVRSRSGQPADATNFRSDFNTDGVVNSGDAITVRARSGAFIP